MCYFSKRYFNTIHANNYEFYEELHAIIDREPVEMLWPRPGPVTLRIIGVWADGDGGAWLGDLADSYSTRIEALTTAAA